MKKILIAISALALTACVSTPASYQYNGKVLGTYSTAAGCGTLKLEQDCSQVTGATRKITIDGTPLRISGSEDGKVVFVMSNSSFLPDEAALSKGAQTIEAFLGERGVDILETKVMVGSGKVFGVHYTLSEDGYSALTQLATNQ